MPPTNTQIVVAKEIIANLKVIAAAGIAFLLLLWVANNTDLKSDIADFLFVMILCFPLWRYIWLGLKWAYKTSKYQAPQQS